MPGTTRIISAEFSSDPVTSGHEVSVTVEYEASAKVAINISADGLKIEPKQLKTDPQRSSITANLRLTLENPNDGGKDFMVEFELYGTHARPMITVTRALVEEPA